MWKQLNLRASLPHETTRKAGRMRIVVNHSSEHAFSDMKKRHRLLLNVSAADLRPPEGVPTFLLDSVLLSMDIFETVQQGRVTPAKRHKASTSSDYVLQAATSQLVDNLGHNSLDASLLEAQGIVSTPASSPTLKRNRSPVSIPTKTTTLPVTIAREVSNHCRLTTMTDYQDVLADPRTTCETPDLQTLIDGALRLSVTRSINSKSIPGIKIKANTFGLGLAEVAPILWRPDYLSVRRRGCPHIISYADVTIVSVSKSSTGTCHRSVSLSISRCWED